MALWGTGYDKARAFIEIEHRAQDRPGLLDRAGGHAAAGQAGGDRGHARRLHPARDHGPREPGYLTARKVDVPWTNKKLNVTLGALRLEARAGAEGDLDGRDHRPGRQEGGGRDGGRALRPVAGRLPAAQLAGAASASSARTTRTCQSQFENMLQAAQHLQGNWPVDHKDAHYDLPPVPGRHHGEPLGIRVFSATGRRQAVAAGDARRRCMAQAAPAMAAGRATAAMAPAACSTGGRWPPLRQWPPAAADRHRAAGAGRWRAPAAARSRGRPGLDLSQVSARKNLNETAFFFPHLRLRQGRRGEDGVHHARGPDRSGSSWALPTTPTCASGYLEDKVVTAKDLMVQPNPPRFLREGDVLEFTVKVTNQSATRQTGTVRLTLADARTGKPVDAALGNAAPTRRSTSRPRSRGASPGS